MGMRDLIRRVLKEALGVPENITTVATKIYNKIINSIDVDDTVNDINGEENWFNCDYFIGDMEIKKINWKIEIMTYDIDDVKIGGMATNNPSKITKDFKIKTVFEKGVFNVKFLFAAPETATGSDFIEYMKKEKVLFISSLSHELKHRYDYFKKPIEPLSRRASYAAYSRRGFGNITPVNEFIHNLYFVHSIENLVRPSEIAGAIDAGEITKKSFYDFLLNNRVYRRLKEIQQFTYEGFRKELLDNIDEIKKAFDANDIDYEGMTDEEIVDKTLELLLLNIKGWESENAHELLTTNSLEQLFGFKGEKAAFFDRYLKRLEKFNGDAKRYLEYEEKMFKFVATNMIKKIAKLYDMTKSDTNESIIDWELWQKINGNNQKIVTEFSFLKESNYIEPDTHPIVKSITNIVGEVGKYESWYTAPFTEQQRTDFVIKYKLDKVSIWKENDKFSGTIKLIITDILCWWRQCRGEECFVSIRGGRMYYRDDLPDSAWSHFEESIIEEIEKWIPIVDVDIELKFPGPKN
jgi:hypothetical protein